MKRLIALAVLAALASTQALAECTYPKSPIDKIPSGGTAPKEEMIAARKVVQEYITAVDGYQECLGAEYAVDMAKPDATEEQKTNWKSMLDRKLGAAQSEKEAVGLRMNEQVRAFNEKHKNEKDAKAGS